MRREADSRAGRFASAAGPVFLPAVDGDLDLGVDVRGCPVRDVLLAFGFALPSVIIRPLLREMSFASSDFDFLQSRAAGELLNRNAGGFGNRSAADEVDGRGRNVLDAVSLASL